MGHELFQKGNSKIIGGSICLKLDITKASDELNWDSLFSTLIFSKFDDDSISLVKKCICTSIGSVLVNSFSQGFLASY